MGGNTITVATFRDRREFHQATKDNNESISDWFNRIGALAKHCSFGHELNAFLLDKFIFGLDEKYFERLCQESGTLTLEKSFKIAAKFEIKSKRSIALSAETPPHKVRSLNNL